ncbi:adenosine deaminase 2-like [Onthophagus taurus]|uniref:adenosine deaminase 2-like n=1 Tax=Onthophagus taurus TaxID=166361 RepID=UPI0039BDA726
MKSIHLQCLVIIISVIKFLQSEENLIQENVIENELKSYLINITNAEFKYLNESFVKSYYDFRRVVDRSPLFNIIKAMPKGANLHGYLYSLASYEYIYKLTWKQDLLGCTNRFGNFLFAYHQRIGYKCELIQNLRKKQYDFDKYLKKILLITDEEAKNPTELMILKKYKVIESLISEVTTFENYIFQMLLEQVNDGISYVEFRTSFAFFNSKTSVYYDPITVAGIINKVIYKFKFQNPNSTFIGAKIVFSPFGTNLVTNPKRSILIVRAITKVFPDLIGGIEFFKPVSLRLLAALPKTVEIYYHRTKRLNPAYFKQKIDHSTSRIALISQREMLSDLFFANSFDKNENRVIEICPTSVYFQQNKIHFKEFVSKYISDGNRLIICNEYPGLWHTNPLSNDWYLVLMFMVNDKSDSFNLFEKIATDSLIYSNLNGEDKMMAVNFLKQQWANFRNQLYLLLNKTNI